MVRQSALAFPVLVAVFAAASSAGAAAAKAEGPLVSPKILAAASQIGCVVSFGERRDLRQRYSSPQLARQLHVAVVLPQRVLRPLISLKRRYQTKPMLLQRAAAA